MATLLIYFYSDWFIENTLPDMKKVAIFFVLFFLTVFVSSDIFGMHPGHRHRHRPRPGAVQAPLDGGALAVLGLAGAAYVAARKKKKTSEEN